MTWLSSRHTRGFTLLEMLIGLTLLGFVMVILFAGLRLSSSAWDAGEARLDNTSNRVVTINFLRQTLEQVVPLRWQLDGEAIVAFIGDSKTIDWIAPMPGVDGVRTRHMIRLVARSGSTQEGRELILRWRVLDTRVPGFSALDEQDDDSERVLATNLRDVEFAYFGGESEQDQAEWHPRWPSTQRLPDLIRLRVNRIDGGVWPDIIIAPKSPTQ